MLGSLCGKVSFCARIFISAGQSREVVENLGRVYNYQRYKENYFKALTGGGGAVLEAGVGRKTEKVISHWFASLQCDNCFMNPPSIFTLLFSFGSFVCRVEIVTLKRMSVMDF